MKRVLSLAALGWALAGCSPASQGSLSAQAASLPPEQACLMLTYEPFETINGMRGPRLDRIRTDIAVNKCEAAVASNPNAPRLLAGAARALQAAAVADPQDSQLEDRALELMQRAADAGDPVSAALLIVNHDYVGRFNSESMLAAAEPALAALRSQPAGDIRRDFAALLLEGAIYTARHNAITGIRNFEAMNRAWDAYIPEAQKRLQAQVAAMGARVGWIAFNELVWELERSGDFCGRERPACFVFNNGLEEAKDTKAALAAAIDSLKEAYRSHDIAMAKLMSSSQDDIEAAMFPGQSNGQAARRYAHLAAEWGGEAEKAAAADLETAVNEFFDYRNRTTRIARDRVQSEETERWIAVGVLVVGALVLIGEAQANSPTAAYDWAENQRRIDCDTAMSIVATNAANNRDSGPFWSAAAAGC